MKLKGLVDEDFVNYKKPSMYLAFPYCSFKCDKECGRAVCQNGPLAKEPVIDVLISDIIDRYLANPLTEAIVIAGLEPFDSWEELQNFIINIRYYTCDDIIIYTGYTEEEIAKEVEFLSLYENIVIKFGRFIPDQESHYDELLGVKLASPNQYAKRISI